MSRKSRHDISGFTRGFALLAQMGITIAVCICLSIIIGLYLDRFLGTSPWLLLLFILFGIIAALKSIFDFSKKL
jgi:ATP synthase protein I